VFESAEPIAKRVWGRYAVAALENVEMLSPIPNPLITL
jgi:hypothetical protein